ncbi:CsgG/HfaB family protein [Oceaniglobus trochenteri]|uniref:CsgG/HfaB family protein n=1 Tax=Oceaniglobus trochenteri TaxID=2763260 RepID=UPI001D00035C|nr:CsgG/HfaB family protein [Oceaniglobus trochenteri]
MIKRTFNTMAAVGLMVGLGACTTLTDLSEGPYPAEFSQITPQNRALREVPAPARRITVSVYDFPDLTGQYKEPANVQSLSRAVSQGGAPMLIKALQDAGERRWFTVLDRSNLESLIRERQIVTEMRRIYRGEQNVNPDALAPLDHSGIILQGGIIGYDSNTMTGGYGARYLGVGGDRKWKLDIVTVSLRAVSTNTGEVLASVVVRKPIASISDRGSIFRYVALDELLEAEAGVAANEPKQLAVEQAIEKAVMALIAEGAELGIWDFAHPASGSVFISNYRAQKYRGNPPGTAQPVVLPQTANAARTVKTRPARRETPRRVTQKVIERRLPPAPQPAEPAPPPPPAAETGETVG